MSIVLALLNDIPILTIAYDHTRVSRLPVHWRMAELLSVSTILGIAGVTASFLLFFIMKELGFSEPMIQSIIFTKLVVAGHLTIFLTRPEDWFWKRPLPSGLLFWTNLLTAILGTSIAVYGFLITPIGWRKAAYVWAYALSWLLSNDMVKMAAYWMLRRSNQRPA